jgi:hypothetical protein
MITSLASESFIGDAFPAGGVGIFIRLCRRLTCCLEHRYCKTKDRGTGLYAPCGNVGFPDLQRWQGLGYPPLPPFREAVA